MQEDSGANKEDVNVMALNILGSEEKVKTIAIPQVKHAIEWIVLAEIIIEKGRKWSDLKDIFAGPLDTASVGVIAGAMTYLERLLDRKVLWMSCRYQISELHIKHVYQKLVSHTNRSQEPLFNAFKD